MFLCLGTAEDTRNGGPQRSEGGGPSLAGIIPRRFLGGRAGLSDASSHRSGFELGGTFCLVESGATPYLQRCLRLGSVVVGGTDGP